MTDSNSDNGVKHIAIDEKIHKALKLAAVKSNSTLRDISEGFLVAGLRSLSDVSKKVE